MHFHFPSFLLGLLFGVILIVVLISLIFRRCIQDDERLFSRQKLLDDYIADDRSLK
jgi:nitrate reductase gamma subunit